MVVVNPILFIGLELGSGVPGRTSYALEAEILQGDNNKHSWTHQALYVVIKDSEYNELGARGALRGRTLNTPVEGSPWPEHPTPLAMPFTSGDKRGSCQVYPSLVGLMFPNDKSPLCNV